LSLLKECIRVDIRIVNKLIAVGIPWVNESPCHGKSESKKKYVATEIPSGVDLLQIDTVRRNNVRIITKVATIFIILIDDKYANTRIKAADP
jgi:hypothetical protein